MSESARVIMSGNRIGEGSSSSRRSERHAIDSHTVARDIDGRAHHVEVTDFSRDGCRFVSERPIAIGARVRIGLSGAGAREGEVVWRDGVSHGFHFSKPLGDSDMASAFTGAAVVYLGAGQALVAEPAGTGRYSRRTRALIFIGSAIAGWAAVIAAVVAGR